MTNQTQFFTEEEVLAAVVDTLENGFKGDAFELATSEVATLDSYIVGKESAENALKDFGIFKALKQVKEYEEENFGSVQTDLTNPEDLASMLYLAIAQPLIYSVLTEAIGTLNISTDEEAKSVIEFIKNKSN